MQFIRRGCAIPLLVLWLALACGGPGTEIATPLAIETLEMVSREPVSSGVFSHTYTATLRNDGDPLASATAFLLSAGPDGLVVKPPPPCPLHAP